MRIKLYSMRSIAGTVAVFSLMVAVVAAAACDDGEALAVLPGVADGLWCVEDPVEHHDAVDSGVRRGDAVVAVRLYLRGHVHGRDDDACAAARRCHAFVLDRSDPASQRYRQFAHLDEVRRIVAPGSEDAATATLQWLERMGISSSRCSNCRVGTNAVGNAVDIVAPARHVQRVFAAPAGVSMRVLRHSTTALRMARVLDINNASIPLGKRLVPVALRDHVMSVRGLDGALTGERALRAANQQRERRDRQFKAGEAPYEGTADACAPPYGDKLQGPAMCAENLRIAVGMNETVTASANTSVFIAVYERESSFSPTAAAQYNAMQGLPPPTFLEQPTWQDPRAEERNNATLCDGSSFNVYCGEASLDMQILAALTAGSVPLMYIGENVSLATWAPAFEEMHLMDPVPPVVSVSSAYAESYYQGQSVVSTGAGATYECEDEVQLCALAARGATIVAGSGDKGASGIDTCGRSASWPCASPVVTCVGGTMQSGQSMDSEQRVCQAGNLPAAAPVSPASLTGGGGFSSLWPQPDFQHAAVSSWWARNSGAYAGVNTSRPVNPNRGTFDGPNTVGFWLDGRAVPDVTAAAHSFPVLFGNNSTGWDFLYTDGTSASTPVVAALAALALDHQQQLLHNTSLSFGCLNPVLYSVAAEDDAWLDITVGDIWCGEGTPCCDFGFNATAGWDPTAGLGVPRYDNLVRALNTKLAGT